MQRPLEKPSDDEAVFIEKLREMLDDVWHESVALRLVGVAITGFDAQEDAGEQLTLFDGEAQPSESESDRARSERMQRLSAATDKVRNRFGEYAVSYGRELRTRGNTTGSSSKNPEDYK